jgi:hypothetical protein
MVRTFGGMGAAESLSLVPNVFKAMLQALFGIDEVLIADDKFYPYAYRTTAAVVKIPTPDETSYVTDPELGRTFIYWPTDGGMFEVNSFPDDDIRSNVYDAIVWYDAEQFNSGAKVLLIGIQMPPNYGKVYTEGFAAIYTDLAKQEKTALLPFLLAPIAMDRSYFLPDQLHPNAKGQIKLRDHVWPALKPLL